MQAENTHEEKPPQWAGGDYFLHSDFDASIFLSHLSCIPEQFLHFPFLLSDFDIFISFVFDC